MEFEQVTLTKNQARLCFVHFVDFLMLAQKPVLLHIHPLLLDLIEVYVERFLHLLQNCRQQVVDSTKANPLRGKVGAMVRISCIMKLATCGVDDKFGLLQT